MLLHARGAEQCFEGRLLAGPVSGHDQHQPGGVLELHLQQPLADVADLAGVLRHPPPTALDEQAENFHALRDSWESYPCSGGRPASKIDGL